ncbi:MAG TPA: DNRLRE domain-containing protein [Bacteroidales bacterium]|nr:DNRLRE domain-containing protein [Bacteroidales bacterium]
MDRIGFILLFVFIFSFCHGQQDRPNILVIITDQHSGTVMNQTGYTEIETPGINKIAEQGVTFTRSYCTYPVCMSSRRSIMTGLMPSKAEPPTDFPSIGSMLAENGYETAYRGRWHVGSTDIDEVKDWHGFQTYKYGEIDSTTSRWSRNFIKQEHNKPFFLVIDFLNPHNICEFARNMTGLRDHGYDDGPVDEQMDTAYCPPLPFNFAIPENEAEGISTRRNQDPGDEHWGANPHKGWTESQWRQYMYGYDRFLEKVDARIEEVYDELEKQGMLENTIVIYTSDHGDAHASHQLTQKKTFYEESVNIPFIVSWKGKTKAGVIDEETLVSNGLDLYPTILKMAGIEIPEYLPGENLSASFLSDAGDASPVDREYVVTELDQKVYKSNTPGVYDGRMLVTKKFKYFIFDQGFHREQLFDLENDPGELHPVTYDPDYHDDLLACREMLKEWTENQNDDFDIDAAIYSVKYDVHRLNNAEPIITQQMFSDLGAEDEGVNINGPSVIRIPDWIQSENRADPEAEYYCYFAHHDGGYIRMAWASEIEGPWHLYQVGAGIQPGNRGVLDLGNDVINLANGITIPDNHLASPDVHVDHKNQRIILYFHSGGPLIVNGNELNSQRTFVSYSPFGLDFYDQIQPVFLGRSYFRVFDYADDLYALANSGTPYQALDKDNPWAIPSGFDFTEKLWNEHPGNPFQTDITVIDGIPADELRVRHTSVRLVDDELQVFYSRRGDLLENIQMSTIDLSDGDWTNWDASYPPYLILPSAPGWEGGDLTPAPSEKSSAPENVNQLRDPYLFEDRDGSLYLFYAGRGEDAIGIAKLDEAHMKAKSLYTLNDAYIIGGENADMNYGTDPELTVLNSTDSEMNKKAFIQFDLSQIKEADKAVIRLFSNTETACPVTVFEVSDSLWSEEEITWNNAPAFGTAIATTNILAETKYYEWDITEFVQFYFEDTITLALYDTTFSNSLVSFSSKEGPYAPELKIINRSTVYKFLPATPLQLFASPVSASEIELQWIDDAVNEEGFTIEKRDNTGKFHEIATVGENITSYRDTDLQSSTEYTYRVYAYNSEGKSDYTNEAFAGTFFEHFITKTIPVTEDAHVRGGKYANDNFGSESILRVKTGSVENYFRKTFIKIDLNAIEFESEKIGKSLLRLYASKAEECTIIASELDDNWTETTVTWASAPLKGNPIASTDISNSSDYYEWDITFYLKNQLDQDGIVSICLEDQNGANADVKLNSKEASNNKPELLMVVNDSASFVNNFKNDFSISLYPNPVQRELNIETKGGTIEQLIINSITGQQIIRAGNFNHRACLNVEHLQKGLYVILVKGDFGVERFKIIKTD